MQRIRISQFYSASFNSFCVRKRHFNRTFSNNSRSRTAPNVGPAVCSPPPPPKQKRARRFISERRVGARACIRDGGQSRPAVGVCGPATGWTSSGAPPGSSARSCRSRSEGDSGGWRCVEKRAFAGEFGVACARVTGLLILSGFCVGAGFIGRLFIGGRRKSDGIVADCDVELLTTSLHSD